MTLTGQSYADGLRWLNDNGFTSDEGDLAEILRAGWLAIKYGPTGKRVSDTRRSALEGKDRSKNKEIEILLLEANRQVALLDGSNPRKIRLLLGIRALVSALESGPSSTKESLNQALNGLKDIVPKLNGFVDRCLEA